MNTFLALCMIEIIIGQSLGQENGPIKVTIESYEIVSYNKDILKDPVITIFQLNETHQGVNGSAKLLHDLGMKVIVNSDIYVIEANGSRNMLTMVKDIGYCEMFNMGVPEIEELLTFGNITKCPIIKGTYVISNAIVDTARIPPTIPRGRFLFDTVGHNDSIEIGRSHVRVLVEDADVQH